MQSIPAAHFAVVCWIFAMLCAFGAGLVYDDYPRFAWVLGAVTVACLYGAAILLPKALS